MENMLSLIIKTLHSTMRNKIFIINIFVLYLFFIFHIQNIFCNENHCLIPEPPDPYNLWYGAYLNGKKIGYANLKLTRIIKDDIIYYEEENNFRLKIKTFGKIQLIEERTKKKYDSNLNIVNFNTTTITTNNLYTDEESIFTINKYGKIEKNNFILQIEDNKIIIEIPRNSIYKIGCERKIYSLLDEPGKYYNIKYFDISYAKMIQLNVSYVNSKSIIINGVSVRVKHLKQKLVDLKTKNTLIDDIDIFVDEKGNIIKVEIYESQLFLRLESEKLSKSQFVVPDIIEENNIFLEGNVKYLSDEKYVFLRIKNIYDYKIDEKYQRLIKYEGNNCIVIKLIKPILNNKLYNISEKYFKFSSKLNIYTNSTFYINSKNINIIDTGKTIVGKEKIIYKKVKLITNWLYKNVKKDLIGAEIPSKRVLKILKGDCTEHAILFAALARSQNIPTKVVSGLVYDNHTKSFYYHAWNEVFIGEWFPVDPTLNQPIAKLGHIKLTEGDYSKMKENTKNYFGRLHISILEKL